MMKLRLFLLTAVLCAVFPLFAQLPDSCSSPVLVRHHYLGTAKVLALRQMLGDPDWADSIKIAEEIYNPILEALSAVYNATDYPERDTVTECLDILAYPSPVNPVAITLTADTTLLWARRLYLDISPTGDTTLDSLLLKYNLQKTTAQLSGQYIFTFQTDEPLNTVALAALFDAVSGAHAEANPVLGEVNDVTLDTVAGGVHLTFTARWGDCPAGCTSHRSWTFLVRPDCSVTFVGVEGNSLTTEVSCTTIFGCGTEPLCMTWLQDSLLHYSQQYSDCFTSQPSLNVSIYQTFNSNPVLGIHVFVGIDAQFTDFFNCSGDYLGTCNLTIGGSGCMPENLSHYLRGDTIWTCSQPLPTPANCGNITATSTPQSEALSFQLFPNPSATGVTSVQADFGNRQQGRLQVFDLYGKLMLEKTFDAASLNESIDLPINSQGLYFVRMEAGGRTATRKLIVLP